MTEYKTYSYIITEDRVKRFQALCTDEELQLMDTDLLAAFSRIRERLRLPLTMLGPVAIVLHSIRTGRSAELLVVGKCPKCSKPVTKDEEILGKCYDCQEREQDE